MLYYISFPCSVMSSDHFMSVDSSRSMLLLSRDTMTQWSLQRSFIRLHLFIHLG
jgi:hypothetical protein